MIRVPFCSRAILIKASKKLNVPGSAYCIRKGCLTGWREPQ